MPSPLKRRGGLQRLLSLLARPVRTAQGRGGIVLQPYRGYGSATQIFLIGRVFRQSHAGPAGDGLVGNLRDISRRIARRAVGDITVTARFAGAVQEVRTDADGYFRVHLALPAPPPENSCWHEVALALENPAGGTVHATGEVFIPPASSRLVVISDIDDTVVETGVANVFKMLWRLFVADAEDRVAFPGVAALYRGLHHGPDGDRHNPMLYVSRAPWGTYDVLAEVFRRHAIPVGPILFLREWGLSWRNPFPRKAEGHKELLIKHILELYRDLPFLLIGDSGQHDPEIYRRIVEENPGRILAVYIRDVSRSSARLREIEGLARAVASAGSPLLMAADSAAIAEHARSLGLLSGEDVRTVRDQAERAGGRRRPAVERLVLPSGDEPAGEGGSEALQSAIGASKDEAAGNVLLEPGPSPAIPDPPAGSPGSPESGPRPEPARDAR